MKKVFLALVGSLMLMASGSAFAGSHYWDFHEGQSYGYQEALSPAKRNDGVASGNIMWVDFVRPADTTLSPGDVDFVVMDSPGVFTGASRGVFYEFMIFHGKNFAVVVKASLPAGNILKTSTLALTPNTVVWTIWQDALHHAVTGQFTQTLSQEAISQYMQANGLSQ